VRRLSVEDAAAGMDPEDVPDWRLRLMFACAHPAIDAAMRDRGLDPKSDPVNANRLRALHHAAAQRHGLKG
jgi:hypothetical protein